MAKRTKLHVVYNVNKWQLKKENSSRALSNHQTKAEAVTNGRNMAKNQKPSQLLIHNKNGRISNEHTYGSDPYPPRG